MRRPKSVDVMNDGSGPRKNGLVECSSCENLSSVTLDATLLESSRLDFELQGDDDVCTVSKASHGYSNGVDTPHQITQRSTRRKKDRGDKDGKGQCTRPKECTGPCCQNDITDDPAAAPSMGTVTTQHASSSSDIVARAAPIKSSSRHKKIQALLGKLNGSISPPRPKNDIHDRNAPMRAESTSHDRQSRYPLLENRRSIRRSKSEAMILSHHHPKQPMRQPALAVSLSNLRKEIPRNQKRVPVRMLRMQQKAVVVIQGWSRRFLARCKVRRLRLLQEYRQYRRDASARNTRLEVQRLEYEDRLMNIQRQTEIDIKIMRGEMEQDKEILKTMLCEAHAMVTPAGCESNRPLDSSSTEDLLLDIHNEVTTLQEEQGMLLEEISELDEMILELEEERDSLAGTNDQIMTMFMVVNDYARGCVLQKEGLEEAARTYNRLEINKVRQEIRLCSVASSVETAAKNVYRNCIYQHVYSAKRMNPLDADFFANLMSIVRECENDLGNPLLNVEEAIALHHKVTSDDLESDDEDDIWDS